MSVPRSPYQHLQPEDRLTIVSLMQQNCSVRSIARLLCTVKVTKKATSKNWRLLQMAREVFSPSLEC